MVSVIIPTYNAALFLPSLLLMLRSQILAFELIIIDSESTDGTLEILAKEDIKLINVKKSDFNHGSTRNLGVEVASSDIVIFLTQDAIPVDNLALSNLVNMLKSRTDIAMAYGRQIPHHYTNIFGRLARLTNYPDYSLIKTKALIPVMGIKTCSCSNSFAAYYKYDLESVGGFPNHTILGEDVSVAARFIIQGKAVAYASEAKVYHSHDYKLNEEFKRYFDIGAFHEAQSSVLKEFSAAESEGVKYVFQELKYLSQQNKLLLIPELLSRTIAKYAGYKLGVWHNYLPLYLKRKFSMHNSFWKS